MPRNWLSRLINRKTDATTPGLNHRDSLFNLPLQPPLPDYDGKINRSAVQLSATVNQAINNFSVEAAKKQLTEVSEEEWIKRGEQRALALFHAAAQHVPAYKDFLQNHSVDPASIRTIEDFKQLPIIDKNNYLSSYPLEQLTWYGDLPSSQMISVSSGSSGEPFFWPRGEILDAETTLEHELFLDASFEFGQHSTLFLVCFAMGMYVAGPITTNSIFNLAVKGYSVTTATPGYSPDDALSIIPKLATKYDQLVLAGYPPYIKEIIDLGIDRGIDWKKIKLRFLLAGEGYNESWRTYVAKIAGDQSPVYDFINLYGSADAAVLAHETQASIIVRRRVAEDIKIRRNLYGSDREPSLLQYHPELKYFEEIGRELVFTAPGGIPLVRYNIHDNGGILHHRDIVKIVPALEEYLYELKTQQKLWNIPFVYVFGKSDQTVILYGANVYPENIRRALEDENQREKFTGKLIMRTEFDHNKDQRLHIDLECARETSISKYLKQEIRDCILKNLLELNSEYRVVHTGIGERTEPIVRLIPFGDRRFHSPKNKHSWTQ